MLFVFTVSFSGNSIVKVTLSYEKVDNLPMLKVEYNNDTEDDIYFNKITCNDNCYPFFGDWVKLRYKLQEDMESVLTSANNLERFKFSKDSMEVIISNTWIVTEYTSQVNREEEAPLEYSYPYNLFNIKVMGLSAFQKVFKHLHSHYGQEKMKRFVFINAHESYIEYFDLSAMKYLGGHYIFRYPKNPVMYGFEDLPNTLLRYKLYNGPYESNDITIHFAN